jgi:hypothetical protein
MNVNLHIERLVLDGLDTSASDGDRISDAVQRELARLIGRGTSPVPSSMSIATVRSAPVALTRGAGAPAIGEAVAHSVYGELNPTSNSKPTGTLR